MLMGPGPIRHSCWALSRVGLYSDKHAGFLEPPLVINNSRIGERMLPCTSAEQLVLELLVVRQSDPTFSTHAQGVRAH